MISAILVGGYINISFVVWSTWFISSHEASSLNGSLWLSPEKMLLAQWSSWNIKNYYLERKVNDIGDIITNIPAISWRLTNFKIQKTRQTSVSQQSTDWLRVNNMKVLWKMKWDFRTHKASFFYHWNEYCCIV